MNATEVVVMLTFDTAVQMGTGFFELYRREEFANDTLLSSVAAIDAAYSTNMVFLGLDITYPTTTTTYTTSTVTTTTTTTTTTTSTTNTTTTFHTITTTNTTTTTS